MRRRASLLAALVVLQGVCAVFFAADAFTDLRLTGINAHTVFEGVVTLALGLGTVVTAIVTRRTIEDTRRAAEALSLAKGAFAQVMTSRFALWQLTPAEGDVAMFTLKGLDVAEIAAARGSAPGTVRVQLAAIYRKADVSSRTQFAAIFLDDLMDGPVGSARPFTLAPDTAITPHHDHPQPYQGRRRKHRHLFPL